MPDSEKIEEPIEELRARFRLDAPFTYSVAVDVQPPVAWKQPYTGIKARRMCPSLTLYPERALHILRGG